ncbi:unnamed protein product [Durusdinium trenchii]|uniref:Uncharacterized protein n=1 Tax=Durusdinium trenchii TaxID=1381693 RepID=A0ABP0RAH6_9DINO
MTEQASLEVKAPGVETEPERTPESQRQNLDLWQKAELALQEERAKKAQNCWQNYRGVLRSNRDHGPQNGPHLGAGGLPNRQGGSSRPAVPTRAVPAVPTADAASSRADDLWHKEDLEVQRRRAAAHRKGAGLRIYDISDGRHKGGLVKGKGRSDADSDRRVYPSKSADSSWKGTLQKDGRFWKVLLSRRQMDDHLLMHWCRWAQPHLDRLPSKAVVVIVDLSFNQISLCGLKALLQTLKDADVPVEGFSLHHNCLNDAAASELAQYIQHSSYTLYELHLSHNQISELGARSLLESAVKALQSPVELVSGRPNIRYPCERNGQQVPLWLRLGQNRIGDGCGSAWVRSFLQSMEHELLAARRSVCQSISEDPWGQYDHHNDAHLFCEALLAYGCDHASCTQTYPEMPGLPPGPVVHLPMLDQQLSREALRQGTQQTQGAKGAQARVKGGLKGKGKGSFSKGKGRETRERHEASAPRPSVRLETVDLLDLESETSQPVKKDGLDGGEQKSMPATKGIPATIRQQTILPEGLGPEVILQPGDEVRILYAGSEDLGDEGFLFASFPGGEGWIPASSVEE